jgi:spectinomycin phosphotransferase
VRERPPDIRDSDVASALARQWPLSVQALSYLPVGFGGYHWLAVDETGARWFVTASDLAAPWVPDLQAAMQTAAWLAGEAGLEFVVAPVPTRAGPVVGSLNSRHALTLFPYLDAAPSRFGDPIDNGDRDAIIDLLAALHTAAPTGTQVRSRPLELALRQTVEAAVASLDVAWSGGPYAEPGRELLAAYEGTLRKALVRFDGLLDRSGRLVGPVSSRMASPTPAICCERRPDCA